VALESRRFPGLNRPVGVVVVEGSSVARGRPEIAESGRTLFPMAKWEIEQTRPVEASPGMDVDAAFAFNIVAGDEARQVTVEYSAPSHVEHVSSASHARGIVGEYLDDDVPPRRIIVDRDGNVSRTDAE
jgi:hypothetical protein